VVVVLESIQSVTPFVDIPIELLPYPPRVWLNVMHAPAFLASQPPSYVNFNQLQQSEFMTLNLGVLVGWIMTNIPKTPGQI